MQGEGRNTARTPRWGSWKKICVTVWNQSPSILCSDMIFQYPPSVKGTMPLAIIHTPLSDKYSDHGWKKKYIHVYFTRRAHFFFCTNCKLNTVVILRIIIFDITFMTEQHVNKYINSQWLSHLTVNYNPTHTACKFATHVKDFWR